MSVINTNITSLIAQQNLGKSQNALSTAMERLSSGMRINSAKDDAAGQAIANRMSAQITGLNQAQRNANDGISVAQTAEGALNQVNDNLQRIRELSVQAANDTNSQEDLQSIQDEIAQRQNEINRISAETDFNGVKVLANDQAIKIQVGANDNEMIDVNLEEITSSTLNISSFDVRNEALTTANLSAEVTTASSGGVNAQAITFRNTTGATPTYTIYQSTADADEYVVDVDGGTVEGFTATFNADNGTFEISSTGAAAATAGAIAADYVAVGAGSDIVVDNDGATDVIMNVDDIEIVDSGQEQEQLFVNQSTGALYVEIGGAYYDATVDTDRASGTYGEVTYSTNAATGDSTGSVTAVTDDTTVYDPADAVAVDTSGLEARLGADVSLHSYDGGYVVMGEEAGQTVYYAAEVADGTGVVTIKQDADGEDIQYNADPLATLDAALKQVDDLRSELGAVQNRFQDAITNLQTNETNLSAARSRIEDADYALEVANMTRAQILQQAGTSVLAQANQLPQNVLSLLG